GAAAEDGVMARGLEAIEEGAAIAVGRAPGADVAGVAARAPGGDGEAGARGGGAVQRGAPRALRGGGERAAGVAPDAAAAEGRRAEAGGGRKQDNRPARQWLFPGAREASFDHHKSDVLKIEL